MNSYFTSFKIFCLLLYTILKIVFLVADNVNATKPYFFVARHLKPIIMRQQDFDQFLLGHPITNNSVCIDFVEGTFKVGFFENLVGDFDSLRRKNQWRFIENNNSDAYKDNGNDPSQTIIIKGDTVDKLTILYS